MLYILLSSEFILNNWSSIQHYQPEIETPEDFIEKAKAGDVFVGGAKIVIQDKLPE